MVTITGNVFVRQWLSEGELEQEIIELEVTCDSPSYKFAWEDFEGTVIDLLNIPKEEGIFSLMAALTITWKMDYFGEIDSSAEVHWQKVTKLSDEEVCYLAQTPENESEHD